MTETQLEDFNVHTIPDDNSTGYILEVNLKYLLKKPKTISKFGYGIGRNQPRHRILSITMVRTIHHFEHKHEEECSQQFWKGFFQVDEQFSFWQDHGKS